MEKQALSPETRALGENLEQRAAELEVEATALRNAADQLRPPRHNRRRGPNRTTINRLHQEAIAEDRRRA